MTRNIHNNHVARSIPMLTGHTRGPRQIQETSTNSGRRKQHANRPSVVDEDGSTQEAPRTKKWRTAVECIMIARPHGNKTSPAAGACCKGATGRAGPERPVSNGPVCRDSHPTQAEAVRRPRCPHKQQAKGCHCRLVPFQRLEALSWLCHKHVQPCSPLPSQQRQSLTP